MNFKFKAAILIQVKESEWCQMHNCDAVYISASCDIFY